jgi:hypothetical protein
MRYQGRRPAIADDSVVADLRFAVRWRRVEAIAFRDLLHGSARSVYLIGNSNPVLVKHRAKRRSRGEQPRARRAYPAAAAMARS